MPIGQYYTLWSPPSRDGRKITSVLNSPTYKSYKASLTPKSLPELGPLRRLTGPKETLYNPLLPSLRRMDMDEALHKLQDEHSRFTTRLQKGDFKSATITLFKPAEKPLTGANITETGRELQSRGYRPLESGGLIDFLKPKDEPNAEDYRVPTAYPESRHEPREPYTYMPEPYLRYNTQQLNFNGYAARYLQPRITAGWKYTLKQEPYVDLRGQRPIPANIYSRYRNPHASDCIAGSPWK